MDTSLFHCLVISATIILVALIGYTDPVFPNMDYLTYMWGSHESMTCGVNGIYLTL
jgi:hypothetical protein